MGAYAAVLGRVDSPGEGQRRAGYRVAVGGLAAVLRWLECAREASAGPPLIERVEIPAASAGTHSIDRTVTVPESLWMKGFRPLGLSVVGGRVGPTMTSTFDPHPLGGATTPPPCWGMRGSTKQVEDDAAREVMRAAARWAAMHSGDVAGGAGSTGGTSPPAAGWRGLPGGGGVRGRRVRRRAGSLHRVRAPLPVPRGGGVLPAPALLGPAARPGSCRRGGWGSSPSAPCASHPRRRRSWTPGRAGGAQDRPGPAGPVDRRGQGPVRPRADRGRPARCGRGRALRHPDRRRRGRGPGPGRRRRRPGRCPGPGGRGRRGRPPPAAPGFHRVPRRPPRPRRRQPGPRPTAPSISPSAAAPRSTAPSTGGAARPPRARRRPRRRRARPAPGDPRPGHRRPGPRVVRHTPTRRSPSSRSSIWPSTSTSAPTRPPPGSSSRPSSATRTCVFPFCFRPAEQCDCEHRVPHADDGPTCSCNLAPCCRRHHRAKTTGGWTYLTVEPGVYLWRSPLGYQFLRDHTGTLDVTPDDERRRLAHKFTRPLRPETLTTPPHTPLKATRAGGCGARNRTK